jgi:hypothetical protein
MKKVAAWYEAWVCSRSITGIAGSNPAGAWKSVSCGYCMLSVGGIFGGPITRPKEFYQVLCV